MTALNRLQGQKTHRWPLVAVGLIALACAPGGVQGKEKKKMSKLSMSEQVTLARADLVERLGPKVPDVELVRADHVTWRSPALGCPMPDRAYPMVVTPGVRIELTAGKKTFVYHGSLSGQPFLCEPPGKEETPIPKRTGRGGSSLDPT